MVYIKRFLIFYFILIFLINFLTHKIDCAQPDEKEFQVKVDVKLKLFDVLVLNSDNEPLKYLNKEKFKLFIDDRVVEIDTFDFVDYSAPEKQVDSYRDELISQDRQGNRKALLTDTIEDKRLSIIIFHNLPRAKGIRNNIAQGIFDFFDEHNKSNDYYAAYFFSGPTITLLLPFTNDMSRLKETITDLYINNLLKFKPFIPQFGSQSSFVITGGFEDSMPQSIDTSKAAGNMIRSKLAYYDDGLDPKSVYEQNVTLYNLDILIRSFSSFKGRKEVFLFSDSLSLFRWDPYLRVMGKLKSGVEFDRFTLDARTNNVTINVFNVHKNIPSQTTDIQFISPPVDPESSSSSDYLSLIHQYFRDKRISEKLRDDLRRTAYQTGGAYYDKAYRKSVVTSGMAEAYGRSSSVYYLGIYLDGLNLDDGKEHSVRIEVDAGDAEVYYQPSFRIDPGFEKMDEVDRIAQFLVALFGAKRYNTLKMTDSLLHFPYGETNNLLVSVFNMPLDEETGDKLNIAVRFYNPARMLDRQLLRTWDIEDEREETKAGGARFVTALPLPSGEYVYRYAARDEENGNLKNSEYHIYVDSAKGLLSSLVIFGTSEDAVSKTNLVDLKRQEKKEDKEDSQEPEFIIDPALNPFNYDGKIFTPITGEPVYRNRESYVMFMYNGSRLSINRQCIFCDLMTADGSEVPLKLEPAEPEKEFPGGWRRVTLKLPLAEIPPDINELKFIVTVNDQSGKEIESESLDIKLK